MTEKRGDDVLPPGPNVTTLLEDNKMVITSEGKSSRVDKIFNVYIYVNVNYNFFCK